MNPKDNYSSEGFLFKEYLLPERFKIIGALNIRGNDYNVIGVEDNPKLPEDRKYCSWDYSSECGFVWGHYGLTKEEALKELIERN